MLLCWGLCCNTSSCTLCCRCIGVIVLYAIFFRVVNALALKFLNFRKPLCLCQHLLRCLLQPATVGYNYWVTVLIS